MIRNNFGLFIRQQHVLGFQALGSALLDTVVRQYVLRVWFLRLGCLTVSEYPLGLRVLFFSGLGKGVRMAQKMRKRFTSNRQS